MVRLVSADGNIVVRQRVMELTIIDEVNATCLVTDLIGVIPAGLARKQIGKGISQRHFFCGELGTATEKARI